MQTEQPFSLYWADRYCGGGDHPVEWYHACLFMVDERAQCVEQEIHFNNTHKGPRMEPYVERGLPLAYCRKAFELEKKDEGSEARILAGWNHILKYGVYRHQKPVNYDVGFLDNPTPYTINCRAGAAAAMEAICLPVGPNNTESTDGLYGYFRMPLGPIFCMAQEPLKSLGELRAENAALVAVLQKDNRKTALAYDLGPGWP